MSPIVGRHVKQQSVIYQIAFIKTMSRANPAWAGFHLHGIAAVFDDQRLTSEAFEC